jgi:hypothetical protein
MEAEKDYIRPARALVGVGSPGAAGEGGRPTTGSNTVIISFFLLTLFSFIVTWVTSPRVCPEYDYLEEVVYAPSGGAASTIFNKREEISHVTANETATD